MKNLLKKTVLVSQKSLSTTLLGLMLLINNVHAQNAILDCASDASVLNTAFNGAGGTIPIGQTDLKWEAGAGDNSGPSSVNAFSDTFVYVNPAYATNPFADANFISPFVDGIQGSEGFYYFRLRFDLNNNVTPSDVVINLDFLADNAVHDIYINNVSQSTNLPNIPSGSGSSSGFLLSNLTSVELNTGWQAGTNEVIFVVESTPGFVAFLAQFSNQSICQTSVTTPTQVPTNSTWSLLVLLTLILTLTYLFRTYVFRKKDKKHLK